MRRRTKTPKLMAEINITPFTDVVLVLLIIFMIATPFIYQSSMKVQLPQATKSAETSRDVIITINAEGDIFFQDAEGNDAGQPRPLRDHQR
jgi:biopolymer transport protein TolR